MADSQRKGRGSKPAQDVKPDAEFPSVAKALRAIRKDFKLTQEKMAPILGIGFSAYRPYERGDRDISWSKIELIAAELGVSSARIARYFWPDEERVERLTFSHDWEEFQSQVEHLPEPIRSQAIRGWRESAALLHNASDLARRN